MLPLPRVDEQRLLVVNNLATFASEWSLERDEVYVFALAQEFVASLVLTQPGTGDALHAVGSRHRALAPRISPPQAGNHQSSGRAAKSRFTFLYHPIPDMGFFHLPFMSFKALSCVSSPFSTISFRWRS